MEKVVLATTFANLKKYGACGEGYRKLAKSLGGVMKYGRTTPINLLQILGSNGVNDCLWALRAVEHPERDRIARYIACDCAEAVLHIYEHRVPNDNRCRTAIEVSRRYADGKATQEELAAAGDAAGDAAWDVAWVVAWAAQAEIIRQYLQEES